MKHNPKKTAPAMIPVINRCFKTFHPPSATSTVHRSAVFFVDSPTPPAPDDPW